MNKRRSLILVRNGLLAHQTEWGRAFANGLRAHGWRADIETRYQPCDLLVMWGVRHQADIAAQTKRGGEVCIVERGYVGDRFKWSSVSFGGGLNGRGIYRGPHHDGSRWDRHFSHLMKPWRETGKGYVLLVGQVPGDSSLRGVSIDAFYRQAADAYRSAGFDVRFRQHPVARDRGYRCEVPGVKTIGGSLDEALAGAACAVTCNSNTAVDAVLAGVPAVAMDEGSMAYEVTGHELGVLPPKPDRTAWAHWLAWTQWTRDEIASGECWAAVGAV